MDIKKTGRLICRKRKEKNISQKQLAEMVHVTPQAVSLWERGMRFPDPDSMIFIHKFLGLSPIELITGLEIYDEYLKKEIDLFMKQMDKSKNKNFYTDNMKDIPFEDLSGYCVPVMNKGKLIGRLVPYEEYYNIVPESK